MAVSEGQLQTWLHQGSVTQSSLTYAVIKSALEDANAPFAGRNFDVFLQGSYGNDTNVYAESDVDVVICLTDTINPDTSGLSDAERQTYNLTNSAAVYTFADFKAEVFKWLSFRFGPDVKFGKKAIFVPGGNGRRDVDVIACLEHRRYSHFRLGGNAGYERGIAFWATNGAHVVNFPKQHMANSTLKHQQAEARFKPTVRCVKNLRNAMVGDGFLPDGTAPSYFLESMLWNVPADSFRGTFQQRIEACLRWLENCDPGQLACANDLHWLIRDGAAVCWNLRDFETFLVAARSYWQTSKR